MNVQFNFFLSFFYFVGAYQGYSMITKNLWSFTFLSINGFANVDIIKLNK